MITRREMFSRGMAAYFGGSFGCMKVLSGCGEVHDEKGAQKLPIVMLELGAKHHEDGIVTNLAARRLICVDLGVADEIGNLSQAYDWGRGEDFLGFGDDVGGDQSDVFASLVYYSGSSYIQFCNFFNTLSYDAPFRFR